MRAIRAVSMCACVVEARSLFTAQRCGPRAHAFETVSRETEFSGGFRGAISSIGVFIAVYRC